MASPEAGALQDNGNSPGDPLLSPFFASRSINRFKSQQTHEGKVQSVTREEAYWAVLKLLKFSNLYRQRSGKYMQE